MILLRAENLSRHYVQEPVFLGLELQIETGERIGLVGPNGAGKTTLLRLLSRRDQPDGGAVHYHPDATVAHLEQFPDFAPEQTLLGEVHTAMAHLEEWYAHMLEAGRQMAETQGEEHRRWSKRYDQLQELLRLHGGYEFQHRIEEVLYGLRFTDADFDRPLSTFSGGEQSRVVMAKLLLSAPDLMLLDEPTNHLDIETTEWLEDYLCRQQASMVIVSHDRYFLDKTVTKVFELNRGKIAVYPGNFQAYVKLRAERQKVAERIRTKQEESIAHYEDFVRKNKSGQLAKQAKAREKMIARIESELVDVDGAIEAPRMTFGEAARSGDVVLTVRDLAKSFDRLIFAGFSIDIERGQRYGILGPNGAGKTTLLQILLGDQEPTSGSVRRGHNVRIGYLEQNLESLDPNAIPLDVVRPPWRATEKAEPFRALLARFGIGADLAENRLGSLSGGERTRVALARICAYEVNLLALDEPTNHLDLWAREALENALNEFDGTVLVVSHDRYFLNQVVNRLLIVKDGRVKTFIGKYSDYHDSQQHRPASAVPPKATAAREAAAEPNLRRKRRFPFRKTADIESDIANRESRLAELEKSLVNPDVYKDGRKVKQINEEIVSIKGELDQLLAHWEEAIEMNPA